MQHVTSTRIVRATPAQLWALLSDVMTVARWNPGVASADLLSERPTGLHAARRCNFYDGSNVREEVIELDEGRRVRLRLSEFSLPMKRLEAEFSVQPSGDGQTEASFTLHYEVKYGLLGQLMGATMVRHQLRKTTARVLAGLGHHASTGELVNQDFVAAAA